jgi:hypothetical protein
MAVFLVVLVLTMVTAIGIFSMRSASLVDLASGFNRQNIQATLIAEYGARSAATWLGPNKEQVMASDLQACNPALMAANLDARCVPVKDTLLAQTFTASAPLGFNDGLMGMLSLPTGSGQQLRAEVLSELTEAGDAPAADRPGSPAGGIRELTVTTKARVFPTTTGSTAICSDGARGVLSQQMLRTHVIVQM